MIEINFIDDIQKVNRKIGIDFSRLRDMTVPMKQSGVYMIGQNTRNFASESTPDGVKWKSLSKATIARRKKGKKKQLSDMILQDTGILKRSITMRKNIEVTKDSMVIEAHRKSGNVDIAKVHQLGSKNRKIPKREFLGFSMKNIDMINRIFIRWAERLLGAR